MNDAAWPELSYPAWRDTAATLQLWTQIVGKVRLALTPWLNHGWQVPLYVTARGLGTSPIPVGNEILEIEFDFIAHRLLVRTSRGDERDARARSRRASRISIARVIGLLSDLRHPGLDQRDAERGARSDPLLRRTACTPSYDADAAHRFWRALVQADRVFKLFRSGFLGKSQPGAFLLGQLRSRGDALFRTAGAAASRRRAGPAGRRDPRGLFARGQRAPASGPAAKRFRKPPSTPTPIPSRRAFATRP